MINLPLRAVETLASCRPLGLRDGSAATVTEISATILVGVLNPDPRSPRSTESSPLNNMTDIAVVMYKRTVLAHDERVDVGDAEVVDSLTCNPAVVY